VKLYNDIQSQQQTCLADFIRSASSCACFWLWVSVLQCVTYPWKEKARKKIM